ncbi:hypothetical protein EHP00_1849 [Ecytonucleospora hepatopenaei]|uniref:HMG box domain-containing protein n=1 Tax=Ecytonucleospora hepatopenaei TaxID=646526 RepID=A0A1W0E4W7_9MICR|nr:hypothetical protein EHP00_1849 [Ecytonucleospora hepatopenaei]
MPKNTKKRKDPNAPKRPLSSYMIYSQEIRQTDEEIKKLSITEQTKAISSLWNELSEEEKKPYVEKAAKAKEEYTKKLEEYKQSDEYKKFMEEQEEPKKSKKSKEKMTGEKLFVRELKENLTEEEKKEIGNAAAVSRHAAKEYSKLSKEKKAEYDNKAKEMN